MNGYGAYRAQALASARETARRVIKSLLPLVRPERRPGSLPALPPARKTIVIRADPSRYGFIERKVWTVPAWDDEDTGEFRQEHPPWETAAMPALTPEFLAAIESGAYRSRRRVLGALRPEGGEAA